LQRLGFDARTNARNWVLIVIAAGLLSGATTLAHPLLTNDTPLFVYLGKLLLTGGVPYRDAWDVKSPGTFFLYAANVAMFGDSAFSVRLFDVLWHTLTALVTGCIANHVSTSRFAAVLAGCMYVVSYFSQQNWSLAQTDGYLALPIGLSIIAVLSAMRTDRLLSWLASGASLGVAVLLKPPFGLLVVPVFLCAVCSMPQRHTRARRVTAVFAGCALPVLVCGVFFYRADAFGDMIFTLFRYAPEYVRAAQSNLTLDCALARVTEGVYRPLHAMALIACGGILLLIVSRTRPVVAIYLVSAWLTVCGLVVYMHGLFAYYHMMTFIAPLSILATHGISSVAVSAARHRRLYYPAIILTSLAIVTAEPARRLYRNAVFTMGVLREQKPGSNESMTVATYIRDHTSPHERIFVWGNAAVLYLRSERRPASRFLGIWPFATKIREVGYRRILLDELHANKPVYFVRWKYADDGRFESAKCLIPIDPRSLENFPELSALIRAEYKMEWETDHYEIFRHVPAGNPNNEPARRLPM
jgi:4-amino-4-deoxy-L-arabinose transferase-like glycosyltransferase